MQSPINTSLGGGNLLKHSVNSNDVIQLGNLLKFYDDGVNFTVFANLDLYSLMEQHAVLATSFQLFSDLLTSTMHALEWAQKQNRYPHSFIFDERNYYVLVIAWKGRGEWKLWKMKLQNVHDLWNNHSVEKQCL